MSKPEKLDQAIASVLTRKPSNHTDGRWRKLELQPQANPTIQTHVSRTYSRIPKVLRDCIKRAKEGELAWPWWIYGQPGNGKTSACLFLTDHVPRSWFWSFDDFCSDAQTARFDGLVVEAPGRQTDEGWREPFSRTRFDYRGFWSWVSRFEMVVIDDVGLRERYAPYQMEVMKSLLDKRHGRATVFTSNTPAESVQTMFDPAIFDRIRAGTVTEVLGKSMR